MVRGLHLRWSVVANIKLCIFSTELVVFEHGVTASDQITEVPYHLKTIQQYTVYQQTNIQRLKRRLITVSLLAFKTREAESNRLASDQRVPFFE